MSETISRIPCKGCFVSDVFDVYRKNQGEVVAVDFSPFGPITDGLLFDWDELNSSEMNKVQIPNSASKKVIKCTLNRSRHQTY